MTKFIYADNASTTQILPEVVSEMMPFLEKNFGNPSSIYSLAKISKEAMEKSRKTIADCINARPEEIFFTSCGTESDNWALKSYINCSKSDQLITTQIEHHAILKTAKFLERSGAKVSYLKPDDKGTILPEVLESEISSDTKLVSIMMSNNEIGTINPIEDLSKICKKNNVKFHSDAVQAVGHIEIDVQKLGLDMMSASGHKFNAPKGVGFLYVRKGTMLSSYLHGGDQELRHRAGTENIASIVGMSKALEINTNNLKRNSENLLKMQEKLIDSVMKIDNTILTGHPTNRVPGTASFCFKGIEGESLLLNLDFLGVCASSGSACTSGSLDPSHVLLSIGLPHEIAHGSLRITLGHNNSMQDVDYICSILPGIVSKLRNMSPLWEKYVSNNDK